MNAMVQKIVDLLFADTVDSEETRALREEVLNNCQERYADLTAQGRTEDEALDAVVESLRGMDEVLAPYRKVNPAEEARGTAYSAGGVRALRSHLVRFDLEVLPSHDGQVHFRTEGENSERITFRQEGDALVLREKDDAVRANYTFSGENMSSFLRDIRSFFFQVRKEMGGGKVILSLPEDLCPDADLRSVSGDITWSGVPAAALSASTTSGDLEIGCAAERVTVQTLSGDIEWRGRCGDLQVKTTSGDPEIEGTVRRASVQTISGDVSLEVENADVREIDVRTTSGYVRVYLPDGAEAQVQTHTVSGGVNMGVQSVAGAPLCLNVRTVSGDIRIR